MEQRITIEQLKELPDHAQQTLANWYSDQYEYDDDLVEVFIPEEQANENGGHFGGKWDSEHGFLFPEEYIGKLKNHRGTILPLLTTGEMIALLNERNNDDLAFRVHLLLHSPQKPGGTWSFDTRALIATLWEGCKWSLSKEN